MPACPVCGSALAGGLCPRCLMADAAQPTQMPGTSHGGSLPTLAEVQAAFPQLEVIELIGAGGMGNVWRARQPTLDRFVALKLLPASLTQKDPAFAERFAREGKLLARLHHPNIVTVHDSGRAGEFFYLIMEFVDGVNLRQAMRASRFTAQQALAIVPKICDALQYAHEEGVLHRDIKPENILLDARGRVKLVDFGIAKLMAHAEPAPASGRAVPPAQGDALTLGDTTLGTPHYMAPEQVERPSEVDNRADIYSLGVVFYELLTGELPKGRFTSPSEKCGADPRVDEIVRQALERERELRQRDAGEFRTQVNTVMQTLPGQAVPEPASAWEYKSKRTLVGLPLVHVVYGMPPLMGRPPMARGILACGPSSQGIFAFGGQAFGVFAFGGIASGIVAVGGLSLGVVSMGGLAAGLLFGYGGIAVAPFATGGCAVGWHAAGGKAVGEYAFGQDVTATHAYHDLRDAPPPIQHLVSMTAWLSQWYLPFIALLVIFMLGLQRWASRRAAGRSGGRPYLRTGAVVLTLVAVLAFAFVPALRWNQQPRTDAFSPMMERLLPEPAPGAACVLSFDSGELKAPPPDLAQKLALGVPNIGEQAMKWLELAGGDAVVNMPDRTQLRLFEGVAVTLAKNGGPPQRWEDFTAQDVESALKQASWERSHRFSGPGPAFYVTPSAAPAALAFITRGGRRGLLEVSKPAGDGFSMRIRYKLLPGREPGPGPVHVEAVRATQGDIHARVEAIGSAGRTSGPKPGETTLQASVAFDIPESYVQQVVPRLRAGDRLPVEVYDHISNDRLGEGFLVSAAEEINATTGTLTCHAEVAVAADKVLLPNTFLRVSMLLSTKRNVVLLPNRAMRFDPQRAYVCLIGPDGRVALKTVVPGVLERNTQEIVSGLAPGDLVVDQGRNDLVDGSLVGYEPMAEIQPAPKTGQVEVKPNTSEAKVPAPEPAFSPVKEAVVPNGVPCCQQYFQFHNGTLYTVGNGPGTSAAEAEHDEQMIEKGGGVDFSAASTDKEVTVMGRGCLFTRDLNGLKWDAVTARGVVDAVNRASYVEGVLTLKTGQLPATYLFKTARGEMGVMEVLGAVTDNRDGWNGHGLKLRYKLVTGTLPETPAAGSALVYGLVSNGLQAAVEVMPGEPLKLRLHVRNASGDTVLIQGLDRRQVDDCLLEDMQGRPVDVRRPAHDPKIPVHSGGFRPGQIAVFETDGLEFESPDLPNGPPRAAYVARAAPGKYSLRFLMHLPGSDYPYTPEKGTWTGGLETAPVQIEWKGPPAPEPEALSLDQAVNDFNKRHQYETQVAKQPPLTVDAVLKAVRGAMSDRAQLSVTNDTFARLERMLATRTVPKDFELELLTGYEPDDKAWMDVWSVRLRIPGTVIPGGTTCIMIHDQVLATHPIGDEERKVIHAQRAKEEAQGGIALGDFESRRKYQHDREAAAALDAKNKAPAPATPPAAAPLDAKNKTPAAAPPPTVTRPPVLQMRWVLDTPAAGAEDLTLPPRPGHPGDTQTLHVDKKVQLDQSALQSVSVLPPDGAAEWRLMVTFTPAGTTQFARLTREGVGRRLAILIGGRLCSAPAILGEIPSGHAEINGILTEAEAKALAAEIEKSLAH